MARYLRLALAQVSSKGPETALEQAMAKDSAQVRAQDHQSPEAKAIRVNFDPLQEVKAPMRQSRRSPKKHISSVAACLV